MTKSMPTNMRRGSNALHLAEALRFRRRRAGAIATVALAAITFTASFTSMNVNASAQNGNAVASARAGSDASAVNLSPADQQFVQDAGTAGATEVAASKLALRNSSDAQVKSFAQRMIADHTRLARNLDIVAQQQGITAAPNADASVTGSLEPLHGADFDKAYVAQVAVDGHRKAIAVFSTESRTGGNAQLKNIAARALPIIKHHYAMAQQLAKLKGVTS